MQQQLPSGMVRLDDAVPFFRGDLHREMREFDDAFTDTYGKATRSATRKWVPVPMRQWSRRWEYPYVSQRLIDAFPADAHLEFLDAGSGLTFFPYWLRRHLPNARITCVDYDEKYGPAFGRMMQMSGDSQVVFAQAALQALPLSDAVFDAVYCVSVLEHTGDYGAVLDEMHRVMKPGGFLVLTFDISLDGRTEISPREVHDLLRAVEKRFQIEEAFRIDDEMRALAEPGELLTTDHARDHEPEMLPWKWPKLKSAYDLVQGRGWSGGFFSLACCCLTARKASGEG